MIPTKLQRAMLSDLIMTFCLVMTGFTLGIKQYYFSAAFLIVAFFMHTRLTRMIEIKEDDMMEGL